MPLRVVTNTIAGTLREQLDAAEPQYRAAHLFAVSLAERYEQTGEPEDAKLLLAALDSLLATPKSQRAAAPKAPTEAPNVGSSLARLRATHAQDVH